MRRLPFPIALVLALLAVPALAGAHPERESFFPEGPAQTPTYRTTGPALVVCKPDSARRIARLSGRLRARNERLLERCRFRHIQAAVNAAGNGTRILVLPGIYREEPSRAVPTPAPACRDDYAPSSDSSARGTEAEAGGVHLPPLLTQSGASEKAPTYAHHRKCPNSLNLIAIVGDRLEDADRGCDDKCDIQIEGTGRSPRDVRIVGSPEKDNAIKADRADGVVLTNFTIEFSDFNNIYVHETNGFLVNRVVTRWSAEYGVLSFTSDRGLYDRIEAYGAGDSGVYPGSGPQREKCGEYGIEMRRVNAHGSTLGYSGTAGDSVYVHDSRFHHNSTGMTMDSFFAGHPGMPQDCARFERNKIYSNNVNYFSEARDRYCKRPREERNPRIVCPTVPEPVGTGMMIAGGNGNLVRDNWIYDNWRNAVRLFWVPAAVRDEFDPTKQFDTSNFNRIVGNRLGIRPNGRRDPNGTDFWWDQEGVGNCWEGNRVPGGGRPSTNGFPLECPATTPFTPTGNPAIQASQATCATWDSNDNTDPPGCSWFERPPEPEANGERAQSARVRARRAATGGGGPAAGPLVWSAAPLRIDPGAGDDRMVSGNLRNQGDRPVQIDTDDVRLLDAQGRPVPDATAIFRGSFVKSLFHSTWRGRNRWYAYESPFERWRIGELASADAGGTLPLTVAWRRRPGSPAPTTLAWPGGAVPLPRVDGAGS